MKTILPIPSLLFLLLIAIATSLQAAKQPNILFIITDQHHARMLSSAGNPYLKTRALDSMAKSGIRFSNAYVTNPVCVPSRISMATGMMAGRFGVFNNGMRATIPKKVSDNSLGKLIKSGGYHTFYGGKVHMAPVLSPLKAGYDEFCKDQRDELPGACIEFMTRKRDKPFFAVASFINPHDICFAYNARQPNRKGKPLVDKLYQEAQALPADKLPPLPKNSEIPEREPAAIEATMKVTAVTPAKLIRKYYNERDWRNYRWIYCRLTERVDAQIGRLLDALKKNGLEKNTLVIFTSDHGFHLGEHDFWAKVSLLDESSQVPLIICVPGKKPAVCHSLTELLDLYPTVAALCGLPAQSRLQGKDISKMLDDPSHSVRDAAFCVAPARKGFLLREEKWSYIQYGEKADKGIELFDAQKDPKQYDNLAQKKEYQPVVKAFKKKLAAKMAPP